MISPQIASEVGSRLGDVVEVEKRQKQQDLNYFMRDKVALLVSKPLHRGGFCGRIGVTFKYERLPMFSNFCGLLGHDLRHCATHFALTKNGGEVVCQYGDWLNAIGGRRRVLFGTRLKKNTMTNQQCKRWWKITPKIVGWRQT